MTNNTVNDLLTSVDEQFAIIELLVDALPIGDENRQRLVQDLLEGPRKCACCINWIDERPPDAQLGVVEAEECAHPIIVRHRT